MISSAHHKFLRYTNRQPCELSSTTLSHLVRSYLAVNTAKMQFAIVTALAAVASAATLEPRQAQEKNISEFSANCIPHSAMCR